MSYLTFNTTPSASGKTKVVIIRSVRTENMLGMISWYGRWRCYVFYPVSGTVWNTDCLTEIQDVILSLSEERKK